MSTRLRSCGAWLTLSFYLYILKKLASEHTLLQTAGIGLSVLLVSHSLFPVHQRTRMDRYSVKLDASAQRDHWS